MKTVLNVKTDAKTKEQAQALAKHLGIPLSVVVNAYLKQFVETGEFKISREPELRPEVTKRLKREIAETKAGKNVVGPFTNAEDFMEALR
mgnify:CR=1 FL=1